MKQKAIVSSTLSLTNNRKTDKDSSRHDFGTGENRASEQGRIDDKAGTSKISTNTLEVHSSAQDFFRHRGVTGPMPAECII